MKINTYNNIKEPKSIGYIEVTDWLHKIKESEYSKTIMDARNGIIDYDSAKASLPAVTVNFQYADYKKDDNCIFSTNYIFIDIDNPDFDINKLDKSKIYSYYKSFGGKGYGIVIQTKGITFLNFKNCYLSICSELGIQNYIDKNAIKHSQYTVLSYDTGLYINPNSEVFDFSVSIDELNNQILNDKVINKKSTHSVVYKEEETYTMDGVPFSIKYTNKYDFDFTENYITNYEDGYNIIECFIPIKKISDGRKRTMLSYLTNLLYLNPKVNFGKALSIAKNVNELMCYTPLPELKLNELVNTVIKQRNENKLIPIYTKRKILFNKNCGLNIKEKLAICTIENARVKTENSKLKIYDIIESWDFLKYGKITQLAIISNFPISRKTVQKYWSEFKEYVAKLNEKYKK